MERKGGLVKKQRALQDGDYLVIDLTGERSDWEVVAQPELRRNPVSVGEKKVWENNPGEKGQCLIWKICRDDKDNRTQRRRSWAVRWARPGHSVYLTPL